MLYNIIKYILILVFTYHSGQGQEESENVSAIPLGLIGMGPHMTEKLIPGLDPHKFNLEYGCRQNFDTLTVQKKQFSIHQITTDLKEVINAPTVQAIIVAGHPENLHVPVVRATLEAGKAVFVEKPLSLNLEIVKELAKQADKSKAICMVGFNMTHTPTVHLLAEKFSRNEISEILLTCSLGVKPKSEPFSTSFDNGFYFSFIHAVSILVKVMGEPTDIQVYGTKTTECTNGFYFSTTCKNQKNQIITLWFRNGLVPAGFNLGGYYKIQESEIIPFNLTEKNVPEGNEKQHSYKNQLDDFYDAIRHSRQPENNFQRNLQIHEIMEEIKGKLKQEFNL